MVFETARGYGSQRISPFGRGVSMYAARRLTATLSLILASALLISCGSSRTPEAAAGEESSSGSETIQEKQVLKDTDIVRGNTAFATALYARLREMKGNLFFSPYSISTALAMTYAGARGTTQKQMADVLNFSMEREQLHRAFGSLEAELNAVREKGDVELTVANALWAQEGHALIEEFLEVVRKSYEAGLNFADFKNDPEGARAEINAWVEEKTNYKIKDLIQEGVLNSLTRLVLTNAIYFKGIWENAFDEALTKEEPFHISSSTRVNAPLMYQRENFGYMENEHLQMLEMRYAGEELSMVVLLPRDIDGLEQVERLLDAATLTAWMQTLGRREVDVHLPRFKTTSEFKLKEALEAMGMSDAFDAGSADFSGMDPEKSFYVSAVIHKAFVDVNEEGTEAAAATAVVATRASAMKAPPVFRADHPFLFLIRHNSSGSILFLGRVVDPTASA